MPTTAKKQIESKVINGIDVNFLNEAIQTVSRDASKGFTRWGVHTRWVGGTRTETKVTGCEIAGQQVKKNFTIPTDEPYELGGTNLYANPQEVLMAALNSCMTVAYVELSALEGIELEEVRIETKGDLDLRGLFALDPKVKPGFDEISYIVHIKGNGTPEQFQKVHEAVSATSPNRYNIANPIKLNSQLVVE